MAQPEDLAAISAAYGDQVEVLFRQLVTALGDQPQTHNTDEQCVQRFAKGLATARRAKQLALDACG